jgi:hypothetical protein
MMTAKTGRFVPKSLFLHALFLRAYGNSEKIASNYAPLGQTSIKIRGSLDDSFVTNVADRACRLAIETMLRGF